MLAQHPENAYAHFALSYVLRYGGAVEESAHECDTALSLDPGNYRFRSCSFTFDQLGNYPRATQFLQLDAGTVWSSSNMMREYIRTGQLAKAREIAQNFHDVPWARLMITCMDNPSSEEAAFSDRHVAAAAILADPDPEVRYVTAQDILFCGQKELAMNMLKSSVAKDHFFCAYSGLQNDSVWAKLKGTPEFAALVSDAKKCRDDFLAKTGAVGRVANRAREGHDFSRAIER